MGINIIYEKRCIGTYKFHLSRRGVLLVVSFVVQALVSWVWDFEIAVSHHIG